MLLSAKWRIKTNLHKISNNRVHHKILYIISRFYITSLYPARMQSLIRLNTGQMLNFRLSYSPYCCLYLSPKWLETLEKHILNKWSPLGTITSILGFNFGKLIFFFYYFRSHRNPYEIINIRVWIVAIDNRVQTSKYAVFVCSQTVCNLHEKKQMNKYQYLLTIHGSSGSHTMGRWNELSFDVIEL